MTIEPEWRSVSIRPLWREEQELSRGPEGNAAARITGGGAPQRACCTRGSGRRTSDTGSTTWGRGDVSPDLANPPDVVRRPDVRGGVHRRRRTVSKFHRFRG